MKAIKIGTNRLISIVLSIVMCATILTGGIWALSNLFKTGMNIVVTYDAPVKAKVYLSTDSTGAGTLRQPSSDNIVTVHNFKKENSALVLNTTGNNENGDAKTKGQFEALGKDSSSLICDANGEMQFYVYVENFSETESVYYRADVNFNGEIPQGGVAPFTAISDEIGTSASTGGGVTSSLLAFKIALNSEFEGIPADQITIKIELATSFTQILGLLGFGQYPDGTFAGMYYIDMGMAPQSYAGTTSEISATVIEPNETWVDGNAYYIDDNNPKIKYVKKSDEYYLVEPVRWIIVGDGRYVSGGGGTLGVDYFADKNIIEDNLQTNQIILISERLIATTTTTANKNQAETIINSALSSLLSKLFTQKEKQLINEVDIVGGIGNGTKQKLFLPSDGDGNFRIINYLTSSLKRKATETRYLNKNQIYQRWWLRTSSSQYIYYVKEDGVLTWGYGVIDIRPMFVINF